MLAPRRRLSLLLAVAALAAGAATGCDTDDAAERDAKDAQQEIDKEAGGADEKAREEAEDAGREVEKGIEDVDGQ
jgi:hypothetical protein